MVHLDAERRALLCAATRQIPAQFLLTGTDSDVFAPLAGTAAFLHPQDGSLQP